MKLSVDKNLWPIPRPYVDRGWENRHMWISFVIGNHHTDDLLSLTVTHDLSERQCDFLMRVFG